MSDGSTILKINLTLPNLKIKSQNLKTTYNNTLKHYIIVKFQ